jgi:hypothetical protein
MNHVKMLVQEKGGNVVHTFGFAYTDKSQEIKWVEKAAVITKNKDRVWKYEIGKVASMDEFQFATYKNLMEKLTQVVDTDGKNLGGIKVEYSKEATKGD